MRGGWGSTNDRGKAIRIFVIPLTTYALHTYKLGAYIEVERDISYGDVRGVTLQAL